MTTHLTRLTFALVAAALPLAAQTTSHSAVHHTATAAHHTASAEHHAEGGCARLPELSPKIPALAAGLPCARPLYTLTRTPDLKLDYVSPLVGPAVRDLLSNAPTTFSLDYVDTVIGTGPLAQPHKWYTVHYTGYLPDGTKFDSSLDRGEPISFPYGQHKVIEGWDTGFEGMHVGGKRRLFVPYQLAYGDAGRPPVIPAKSELIFDVELVGQSDQEPKPAPRAPQPQSRPGQPAGTPPPGARSFPPPSGGRNVTPPAGSPAGSTSTAPATRPNTPIDTETPNATAPKPKL
jgi:peptidylprolyl isomerase